MASLDDKNDKGSNFIVYASPTLIIRFSSYVVYDCFLDYQVFQVKKAYKNQTFDQFSFCVENFEYCSYQNRFVAFWHIFNTIIESAKLAGK